VTLLADPDGSVARRYGVLLEGGKLARAATFLVNPEGRVWGNWFPDSYRERPAPDQLLAAIR
jgi:peroxiredoxin